MKAKGREVNRLPLVELLDRLKVAAASGHGQEARYLVVQNGLWVTLEEG